MGLLKQVETDQEISIRARCLIGRHPGCDLRLDDPRVSSEHSSVHWTGERWEIRDLGSRNGTTVDGNRLPAGGRAALAEGSVFSIGSGAASFVLVDVGPPVAAARHVASGLIRQADGGMLVLPEDDHPRVSLFEDTLGRWIAELEDERRVVGDGEVVVVGGEAWALSLPVPAIGTCDGVIAGPTLETMELRFRVSRNEEQVEVVMVHGGGEVALAPRTYHYLLLTLARARLADREAPIAEQGWIDREALCKMLATDSNKLNVEVFRARKQLAALGVHGAAGIIARRPGSGEIRLGTARVEVGSL